MKCDHCDEPATFLNDEIGAACVSCWVKHKDSKLTSEEIEAIQRLAKLREASEPVFDWMEVIGYAKNFP